MELLDPAARPDTGAPGEASRARRQGRGTPTARTVDRGTAGRGPGRRVPDLAALPRLLHATGSFGTLRERLGPVAPPTMHGRHVGLTAVPHGAKSFLAAALALDTVTERVCWVARDAEIGDRVAEELGAWLGDPALVAVLEPRTSLAYERSELVPDETAARVAALAAWRDGSAKVLVASVQALLQATLSPDDLPATLRTLRPGSRIGLEPLLAELFDRGYTPVLEVAGRGEFARRGGIVDVFPPSASLPVRMEFFGDEIDSLRAFDPTDQRSVGPVGEVTLLPATEFLLPDGGAAAIRARLGRLAGRLPERLALDLARFAGEASPERPAAIPAGRALPTGDAAEVWSRLIAPSTGLDHLDPATLFVLDEPGDLADAADFLWRQADERHGELVEQGELPRDWPQAFLPPRDWKARLHGARTLELTWQSEAGEAAGMAFASKGLTSGDLFGWREPVLAAGADGAPGRRRRALAGRAGARRARVGPGAAPRGAPGRGGSPGRDRQPRRRAAAARGHRAGRAEPQRGLRGRPGRPGGGHRPRAVRERSRPASEGDAPRRAPRHPRAPGHRGHGGPHRPRHRTLRADAPARRGGPGAGLPGAQLRGGRQDLRPRGADQPGQPLLRGRQPAALAPGRHRLAADQAAGPQGRQRPRRGAARPVRQARGRGGLRLRRRHAVAGRDGGVVPVRGDAGPAPGRHRGQGGHGGPQADGPARRGRRGLRQDRGGAAGRVQGHAGRQAGRGARPHYRASRAALHHVHTALRGVPDHGQAAVAVRGSEGAGDDGRGAGKRGRGHRHRDAPAAVEGRRVQGPGPGGGGRGAAVRGRGQGAAQAAAIRRRRAHAERRRPSRARSTSPWPASATCQ